MDQPTVYIKAKSLPQIDQYVEMERARLSGSEVSRYNQYRHRYDTNPRAHVLDGFPPVLQIEPTSICNYRCPFCFQTDPTFTKRGTAHMGMMTMDLFQRAIDEANGQCEAITLASRGEPLLHPQIAEMLAYTAGKFLALKVNTNGYFLDEELSHAILAADINTLVVSAEAVEAESYAMFRVRGRFETVVTNVAQFRQIQQRQYPKARTLLRVSGVKVEGTPSLEQMQRFWGWWADQVCYVDYNPWENTYKKEPNDITEPCSDLWRRLFLWWDGTVNPCDVDYRSLLATGKFPYETLADVWNGEHYNWLRRQHLEGKRGECNPCQKCTVV
jgi:organic radical activating enzyme